MVLHKQPVSLHLTRILRRTLAVRQPLRRRLVRFRSTRMSSTILRIRNDVLPGDAGRGREAFHQRAQFLAGYTLSRLMDNTSSGFSSFTSGGINK